MNDQLALIAGGGIAGLATAIALSRAGRSSHVFESRPEFSEVGAGIQIGPNGTRILRELGAAEVLEANAGKPQAIDVRLGRSGEILSRLPLGRWIEGRHGAPYWTAHRADLHAALLAVARTRPDITISNGFDVFSVEQRPDRVTIADDIGVSYTGTYLIGADGVGSTVRRLTFGDLPLRPAGRVAARSIIPIAHGDDAAIRENVCLWLAPKAHIVHYPVRGGRELAVVVVLQDETFTEGWGTSIGAATVLGRLVGIAPHLLSLLGRAGEWRQWTLLSAPRLPSWSAGRILLAGDATGPFFPFLAQGGVMALEDAVTIARLVAATPDVAAAFRQFETVRRHRRERMIDTAARNGRIYHLDGPMAFARNMTLRAMGGERVMAGYDWLYGHRA